MASLLHHVKEAFTSHHPETQYAQGIEPGINPRVAQEAPNVPKRLYHTTLTVVDPHTVHTDPAGSAVERSTFPLGTLATREAATRFAEEQALRGLGYEPDDFEVYETKSSLPGGGKWAHGEDALVYARTPAGQEFIVRVEDRANKEHIAVRTDESPEVHFPTGSDHLSYVLVTETDYRNESTKTAIQGCYYHRIDALDAAKEALLASGTLKKSQFGQYDERETFDRSTANDWPFGEDVVVHAVGSKGENFKVAIKTVPGAHQKHGKMAAQKK